MTLAINPFLYKSLRYNVQKDFVPIAQVATSPTVLVVTNALPAKNLQEFVAYARANPGKVNFGSGGSGTSVHLAGELFASVTSESDDARAVQGQCTSHHRSDGWADSGGIRHRAVGATRITGGKCARGSHWQQASRQLPNVPTFAGRALRALTHRHGMACWHRQNARGHRAIPQRRAGGNSQGSLPRCAVWRNWA